MEIISGKQSKALKVVIYGPEGIGKSTLAAAFPDPVFIDTEGSTTFMDVRRFKKPASWTELLDQVRYVQRTPGTCGTLVLDTADWAEQLCN
ncbi:MAG: ATP-binding protein, partial [Oscillospiraceae bacterium]|nr:ATP-binding protein [Oscillospiraceae bacterium]